MIKYDTNVEVPNDAILYLRTLDDELANALRSLVNKEGFRHIIVSYNIIVDQSSDEEKHHFLVSSNASQKIENSSIVANAIYSFLSSREKEFNRFIGDKLFIEVNVEFKQKQNVESQDNNDYGQSKNDELPYYAPIKPQYDFNQIILPENVREEIREAINIINYQDLIYNTWGFNEVDSIPKSILNFYGPPGTGKTMCAHAIANQLGKKLLALNYSEIESKYVGDAPKNLQRAFEIATKEDCILFFDEADSFLGKRIQNVTQGADQALNSLRSQMLILLEEHSGIVIFATNLVSNFDTAFESRILKHIKFELPNEEARIAIIKKMIPSKLPLQLPLNDEQLLELSKITEGFSGREIKNAVLGTLLAKATKEKENAIFTFNDFERSFISKKNELTALKEEKGKDKKRKIKKALENGKISSDKEEAKPE